jgi:predicted Abi (CAAX) family protease
MNLLLHILEKLVGRILSSIFTFPDHSSFVYSVILLSIVATIALPLGLKFGFLQIDTFNKSWKVFLQVMLVTLFLPAIAEEIVFRVLFLPHITEKAPIIEKWLWGGISLILFVAYHPINAKFFYPAALSTFTNPIFLTLSAVLGVACTISYLLSGSLWLPAGIHWLTVIIWLLLLGGYDRLRRSHEVKER